MADGIFTSDSERDRIIVEIQKDVQYIKHKLDEICQSNMKQNSRVNDLDSRISRMETWIYIISGVVIAILTKYFTGSFLNGR